MHRRIFIVTTLVFMFVTLSAQTKLAPEFDNVLYCVNSADSSLTELQHERVDKYKAKHGIGSLKMLFSVEGPKSKIRLKGNSRLTFAINYSKDVPVSNLGSVLALHKAKSSKTKRESLWMGVSGRKSHGDENIVEFKTKKIGDNLILIVVENPAPGEYYFIDLASPSTNGGNYQLYSFGVD